LLRLSFIQCCCRHQIRLRSLSHWLQSHYLQRRITKTTSRLKLLLSYSCFLHCTARFSCSSHHRWGEREWRFVESSSSSSSSSRCEIFTTFRSISRLERHNDEGWSEEWREIRWQWGCSLTVLSLTVLLLFISLLSSLTVLLLFTSLRLASRSVLQTCLNQSEFRSNPNQFD